MAPKINSNDTDDILAQISVDDEDHEQLGDNQPDQDDDDTTGPVEDNDDNDDDLFAEPEVKGKKKDDDDDDFDPKERLREDAKGNLIDKNGKIVAAAGKERGIVQKLKKRLIEEENATRGMAKQLADIASGTRELMTKYKELQEQKTYGTTLGLDDAEQKEALQIFAQSKLDPKGALKKILTKYHLNGNDLSELGISGPLDPAEVARHMLELQEAKKPKPATDPVEEKSPEVREAEAFMGRYPELQKAPPEVLTTIADAKNRFPHMTLDEIWIKIRTHLQAKKQQPKPDNRQQQRKPGRPIPHNGSQPRTSNKRGVDTGARDPNKSFTDIGKELLNDLKALEAN